MGVLKAKVSGSWEPVMQDATTNALTPTQADTRYVNTTGDTMTGELKIVKTSGDNLFYVDTPATNTALIGLKSGGVDRWSMFRTGNVQQDFVLSHYNDAGAYQGNALFVERASGKATVIADPTADMGIANKRYVDNKELFALSEFEFTMTGGWAQFPLSFNQSRGSWTWNNGGLFYMPVTGLYLFQIQWHQPQSVGINIILAISNNYNYGSGGREWVYRGGEQSSGSNTKTVWLNQGDEHGFFYYGEGTAPGKALFGRCTIMRMG